MKGKGSLTVNIPHPCTQSWNDMVPEDGGRFCLQCQKKVIDFSTMTDQQVLTVLSRYQGSLCGNFQPEQLDRTLLADAQPRHSFLPAAMFASLMAAVIPGNSKAQEPAAAMAQLASSPADHVSKTNTPGLFKGQIIDSLTNEGLPGVTIALKGSGTVGAVSDATGKFQLTIPSHATEQLLAFRISYLGYNTKEISFSVGQLVEAITIPLQQSVTDLQELVVTSYEFKRKSYSIAGAVAVKSELTQVNRLTWWQRIAHLFRKKEKCTQ